MRGSEASDNDNAHAVAHAQFTIVRHYAAAPAWVFAAWADPAIRQRWFVAADDWEIADYRHDFRVGGCERGRFRRIAGDPFYDYETHYLDIVAPRRIVTAYAMARDGVRISASLLTVQFDADGSRTRLSLTEQGAFLDRQDSSPAREQGWQQLLAALGREFGEA
ncbi:MAG: activator of HSP90 ATPase [Rhodanobacteraceae bacterium]